MAAESKQSRLDDELLESTLCRLEDLFLDSFHDAEEEWNSPSKGGEELRDLIQQFEQRAALAFLPTSPRSEGKDHGNSDEFTLEQSRLHREFCALVERQVEQHLVGLGVTAGELAAAVGRVGRREERSWAKEASREILALLCEVDDFELWARNMRQKAATLGCAAARGGK